LLGEDGQVAVDDESSPEGPVLVVVVESDELVFEVADGADGAVVVGDHDLELVFFDHLAFFFVLVFHVEFVGVQAALGDHVQKQHLLPLQLDVREVEVVEGHHNFVDPLDVLLAEADRVVVLQQLPNADLEVLTADHHLLLVLAVAEVAHRTDRVIVHFLQFAFLLNFRIPHLHVARGVASHNYFVLVAPGH